MMLSERNCKLVSVFDSLSGGKEVFLLQISSNRGVTAVLGQTLALLLLSHWVQYPEAQKVLLSHCFESLNMTFATLAETFVALSTLSASDTAFDVHELARVHECVCACIATCNLCMCASCL